MSQMLLSLTCMLVKPCTALQFVLADSDVWLSQQPTDQPHAAGALFQQDGGENWKGKSAKTCGLR